MNLSVNRKDCMKMCVKTEENEWDYMMWNQAKRYMFFDMIALGFATFICIVLVLLIISAFAKCGFSFGFMCMAVSFEAGVFMWVFCDKFIQDLKDNYKNLHKYGEKLKQDQ